MINPQIGPDESSEDQPGSDVGALVLVDQEHLVNWSCVYGGGGGVADVKQFAS